MKLKLLIWVFILLVLSGFVYSAKPTIDPVVWFKLENTLGERNNVNYGQEEIEIITITEDMNNYSISLKKTGENNPNNNNQQSSSSSSGGGGGSSVTNIFQNITYIINQPEEKEKQKSQEKESVDEDREEKETEEKLGSQAKTTVIETNQKSSGFGGLITGAAVGLIDNVESNLGAVGVLIVICLILGGLVIHYRAKSKR